MDANTLGFIWFVGWPVAAVLMIVFDAVTGKKAESVDDVVLPAMVLVPIASVWPVLLGFLLLVYLAIGVSWPIVKLCRRSKA